MSIQIEFSYIQELAIIRNRFYEFVFYSTLGPRYLSRHDQIASPDTLTLSSYPVIKPKEGYVWNIEVRVKCNSAITYLECPSHVTNMINSENLYQRTLVLQPTEDEKLFNKTFRVLLSFANISVPTYRLASNDQGYCIKVDFLPLFAEETLDDAIIAMKKDQNANLDDINVLSATGEFIFLIDRSGSMSGERISMAKQALLYALKSLPPRSFFNIYSFGSDYYGLYPQPLASTEKNINDAIKKVEAFSADMGGTEIYDPIFTILSTKRLKKHPRTLFLLTDGDVSNPDKVINLVRVNNHRARVFTLGIGNGCSQHLIKETAKAGQGCSEFVDNPSDISGK